MIAGPATYYNSGMASDLSTPAGFDDLWKSYPWPDAPPLDGIEPAGRDQSGFDLLGRVIGGLGKENPVIMEIGAEFGGSTRKFLSRPETRVVSVDPWPDSYGYHDFPPLQKFKGRERGMYDVFLTLNFEYRDRLATVREFSPAGPLAVYNAGVEVDMVYIDGDHRYDAVINDLTIAAALFPNAVLTGDDWLHDPTAPKYEGMSVPVQLAVRRWAAFHKMSVQTDGESWVLDRSKPYNLGRPRPAIGPTEVSRRLDSIEKAQQESLRIQRQMQKSQRKVEGSLTNLPSRRVLRKVRSIVKRSR